MERKKQKQYSEQLDQLDASIFTGEMLELNLEELKSYLNRWAQEVERHESSRTTDLSPWCCAYCGVDLSNLLSADEFAYHTIIVGGSLPQCAQDRLTWSPL